MNCDKTDQKALEIPAGDAGRWRAVGPQRAGSGAATRGRTSRRLTGTLLVSGLLLSSFVLGCGEDSGGGDGMMDSMVMTPDDDTTGGVPTMPMGADDDGPAGGAGGTPAASGCTTGSTVLATEEQNYFFSSTLSFNPVAVAPNSELTFDWSAVDTDFLGHALDPAVDLGMVSLLLWNLDDADLAQKLNDDELVQLDLVIPSLIFLDETWKGGTVASLFDFTSFGMPLDQDLILSYMNAETYDPADHTYTFIIQAGTMLGDEARMIQTFTLDPDSTTTEIVMTNDSTQLEYTVDLLSHTHTMLPAGDDTATVDWTDLTTNALQQTDIQSNKITEVLVAKYSQTPEELQDQFLDLELISQEEYRAGVPSGTTIELSELQTEAGDPFPGVDDTGTWILALFCGDCQNPAPWYLSVIDTCTP